ncbi:DUF4064 domain-containing protein [Saccharopolyspora elongata]|uniref:Uncharacterized protein n=1 Tax=Saccharopolyspora elongata TaxID=2530387 RepID=A0A4R4Y286_9PSEU|nr:DUF4064 domain-containing protein [Saccharopolyspora elongata]TDD36942.1 hypothetical protein E1288_41165 [Saccharopolyspora elongata]
MSSPQPPDGGQQGSDPISNRMDPQDPNQAGSDATQVVRPVQPQGQQQPPSDSTQVVPPSMQPPQPMYQQPGLAGQGSGAEATAMVPPSMQPPQPMYQQPGTQSQPGGFPSQPQGTPSGGFPAPQAQGGFGAQPPQAAYGQPAAQGQGSKGLALTAGWVATAIGAIGAIFNLIGLLGLGATYAWLEQSTADLEQYKEYGIEVPEINLPPYGLMMTLYIGFLIASLVLLAGGIMVILKKNIGPILVVAASGLYAICQLVTLFTGFVTGISIVGTIVAILIAAAIGVLAFLPGTRQYIAAAGSGVPAPAAAGGFGQPGQPGQPGGFGQPGQPQQFGQPGQQPGGFPPAGGQQPPQPPQW